MNDDKGLVERDWVPQIGEECRVVEGCADWADDWTGVRVWVAGVDAVQGGGYNVTVTEQWPLQPRSEPFGGNTLTDGFHVGTSMVSNMLAPVGDTMTARIQVLSDRIAVLEGKLRMLADESSWRGFSPVPQIERMRAFALAALTPQESSSNAE